MNRKILLVEDENHKKEEISNYVNDIFGFYPDHADSVRTAVIKVSENDYSLVILDMALSTFGSDAQDNKKGHDQAQGGIEVLRELKANNKKTSILIVTQYHDFYLGGNKIKLKNSPRVIEEKYSQIVIGAVLYTYKSKSTKQSIIQALRSFSK